jgi:hypothetical protein
VTEPSNIHEKRLLALDAALNAARSASGAVATVVSDTEDLVGQLDAVLDKLIVVNQHVTSAVGDGVTTGAVLNANTQVETAIEVIHLALNAVNDAQVAADHVINQVETTITQVRAAPNN